MGNSDFPEPLTTYQFFRSYISTDIEKPHIIKSLENMMRPVENNYDIMSSQEIYSFLDFLGIRQSKVEQRLNILFMCFILFSFTMTLIACLINIKSRKIKKHEYVQVTDALSEKTVDI